MSDYSQDEVEQMYGEELNEFKNERRLKALHGNNYEESRKKGSFIKLPCCLVLLLILGLSAYLVYYFYINIKDPLYKEYLKEKENIEQSTEKINEIKNNVNQAIESGKDLINKAEDTKESFDQAYEDVENVKQGVDDLSDYSQKFLE